MTSPSEKECFMIEHLKQRLCEEAEKSDDAFATLSQSTERFVASLRTHQALEADLTASRSLLSGLFVRVNLEDLILYAALLFYVCVLLYILLARTLLHWFF